MANYRSLLLYFLIVVLEARSTLQLEYVLYDWSRYTQIFNTTPYHLSFKPTESSPKALIAVKNVTDAISDAGYEIMSLILQHQLTSLVPYNEAEGKDKDTVTIYNNQTVTIFIPRDEAIRVDCGISLEYQVVLSKVEREGFRSGSMVKGSELVTADNFDKILVITEDPGRGSAVINGMTVGEWDIYNDGHLIIHGVEDFFASTKKGEFTHVGELDEPFIVYE